MVYQYSQGSEGADRQSEQLLPVTTFTAMSRVVRVVDRTVKREKGARCRRAWLTRPAGADCLADTNTMGLTEVILSSSAPAGSVLPDISPVAPAAAAEQAPVATRAPPATSIVSAATVEVQTSVILPPKRAAKKPRTVASLQAAATGVKTRVGTGSSTSSASSSDGSNSGDKDVKKSTSRPHSTPSMPTAPARSDAPPPPDASKANKDPGRGGSQGTSTATAPRKATSFSVMENEARSRARAQAAAEALAQRQTELKTLAQQAEEKKKAEREAARKAALAAAEKAAEAAAAAAREKAAETSRQKAKMSSLKQKLWAKVKAASSKLEGEEEVPPEKLREALEMAQRRRVSKDLENALLRTYKLAVRRATAREKAAAALARWEEFEARDARTDPAARAAQEAAAAEEAARMEKEAEKWEAAERAEDNDEEHSVEVAAKESAPAPALASAAASPAPPAGGATSPRRATRKGGWKSVSAAVGGGKEGPPSPPPKSVAAVAKLAAAADKESKELEKETSKARALAEAPPVLLADARAIGLPPIDPLPQHTSADMRNSLRPVMQALSHDISEAEMDVAQEAFASWNKTQWRDPRSGTIKSKASHGWTIEQYGLNGFSALYARKLHVPRVACARQIMLWIFECAPGLPDEALVFSDLGAGTCAACLGARLALRDHAGDEQNYHVYPIDVASSSARFANAFRAMTKAELFGRPALLPFQDGDQYLQEEEPGVDCLVKSLFAQLEARGERQPHFLLASFSLHYLKKEDRDAFFTALATLVSRPMLLVIIKGVGQTQRPAQSVIRSVYLGLHYVIGKEKHPRVVEAHVCLVLPRGHPCCAISAGATPPYAPLEVPEDADESDAWLLRTFATMERRLPRHGLRTGLSFFESTPAFAKRDVY